MLDSKPVGSKNMYKNAPKTESGAELEEIMLNDTATGDVCVYHVVHYI